MNFEPEWSLPQTEEKKGSCSTWRKITECATKHYYCWHSLLLHGNGKMWTHGRTTEQVPRHHHVPFLTAASAISCLATATGVTWDIRAHVNDTATGGPRTHRNDKVTRTFRL
jgi:hypothetical protein